MPQVRMHVMNAHAGVLFALIALFGWAFGDFFIQKATRAMGWYKALFLIGIAGFFGLAPFAFQSLPPPETYPSLAILSVIVFIYAWAIFEALRVGKISVVESVVAIELPFTVSLGIFIGGERLTTLQGLLFLIVCAGIVLAATKEFGHFKRGKNWLEKGVLLAFFGGFLSALTNFYIGSFSHIMSPLVVIWFIHSMLGLICAAHITAKGEWRAFRKEVMKHKLVSIGTAAFDNAAWVGYAFATSMIPTSLVVTMTESYIALAALLGWIFGHERIRLHQIAGALLAFAGVFFLSTTL